MVREFFVASIIELVCEQLTSLNVSGSFSAFNRTKICRHQQATPPLQPAWYTMRHQLFSYSPPLPGMWRTWLSPGGPFPICRSKQLRTGISRTNAFLWFPACVMGECNLTFISVHSSWSFLHCRLVVHGIIGFSQPILIQVASSSSIWILKEHIPLGLNFQSYQAYVTSNTEGPQTLQCERISIFCYYECEWIKEQWYSDMWSVNFWNMVAQW